MNKYVILKNKYDIDRLIQESFGDNIVIRHDNIDDIGLIIDEIPISLNLVVFVNDKTRASCYFDKIMCKDRVIALFPAFYHGIRDIVNMYNLVKQEVPSWYEAEDLTTEYGFLIEDARIPRDGEEFNDTIGLLYGIDFNTFYDFTQGYSSDTEVIQSGLGFLYTDSNGDICNGIVGNFLLFFSYNNNKSCGLSEDEIEALTANGNLQKSIYENVSLDSTLQGNVVYRG